MSTKKVLTVVFSAWLDLTKLDTDTIFVHFSPHTPKGTVNVYVLAASPLCKDMSCNPIFEEIIFYDARFTGFATKIKNGDELTNAFPDYQVTYIGPVAPTEPQWHGDYLF